MKKMKRLFTLVELLAVIAIIGILAGILIPALGGAQLRGKITQAKSDMKTIETALEAFASDNGGRYVVNTSNYSWGGKAPTSKPTTTNPCAKYLGGTSQQSRSIGIILELSDPENVTCSNNKRKIRYLDPSKGYQGDGSSSTVDQLWPDPWGNAYAIELCTDGSGKLTPHTGHNVYSSVVLWSYGPDGSNNNGANAEADNCTSGVGSTKPTDDIASWHK